MVQVRCKFILFIIPLTDQGSDPVLNFETHYGQIHKCYMWHNSCKKMGETLQYLSM